MPITYLPQRRAGHDRAGMVLTASQQKRLAVRLDPVGAVMTAAHQTPDAWQREITDGAQDTVVVTARQSGKSSCAAALVAGTMLTHAETRALLIAPAQRQSQLLLERVRGYLDGIPHEGYRNVSRSELRLNTGAVCWAMPSTASTIRGFDKINLLICDEAAWVGQSALAATMPMLAHATNPVTGKKGGRFIALSTPGAADGWYYNAVQNPEAAGFQLVRVPAGRVDRLTEEFLANMRARWPEAVYRTEYECSFEVSAGALFDQLALAEAELVPADTSMPSPEEWLLIQQAEQERQAAA